MSKTKRKTKGGPPKPRATDAVIEQRILVVLQLLIDGAERHDTLQYVAKKEADGEHPWTMDADRKPLCERTIDGYIAEANKRIAAICLQRSENPVGLAILRMNRLYAREMEDRNWEGANRKLQELHRLQDLYPAPKKQEIDLTNTAKLVLIEEIIEVPADLEPPSAPPAAPASK